MQKQWNMVNKEYLDYKIEVRLQVSLRAVLRDRSKFWVDRQTTGLLSTPGARGLKGWMTRTLGNLKEMLKRCQCYLLVDHD